MQRLTHLIAALAAAVALAATLPALAAAGTTSSLEIVSSGSLLDRSTIHPGPGLGTAAATLSGGIFDSSGAIETSGRLTIDVVFSGAAPDSDVVHGSATFTTETGSFTLQFQALHLPFSNPVFDGSWVLTKAGGAYTGMHATGSVEFTVHGELGPNPIIDAVWNGSAHTDPS